MTLQTTLEDLALFPDWESRYTYVIDLAKSLPPMPESEKTEANKVRGCTSQVWLTHTWSEPACNESEDAATLSLHLDSDALIVKGLLALVHQAYNGLTRTQIAQTNLPALLEPTGLLQNLSPNRRNGFASVVARVQHLAAEPFLR